MFSRPALINMFTDQKLILKLSYSNTVHTSSNKMTGSVRISQAMLALFLSPPDSPGIISPPITATSEQENSINLHNSQFFQFGYCIDIYIYIFSFLCEIMFTIHLIVFVFLCTVTNIAFIHQQWQVHVLQIFLSLK